MSDAPERIWLLPFDGEQRCWCNHPDPSGMGHEDEADEYIRVDLYKAAKAEIARLTADPIASRRASAMPGLGYLRVMEVFDKNETAGSFLHEDGEGGFASAVQRMADEIDRLKGIEEEDNNTYRQGFGAGFGEAKLTQNITEKMLREKVARLTDERDAAIKALCEAAQAKGQAEGKLAASEMAGVVEGWKTRAEKAEAERDHALASAAASAVDERAGQVDTTQATSAWAQLGLPEIRVRRGSVDLHRLLVRAHRARRNRESGNE